MDLTLDGEAAESFWLRLFDCDEKRVIFVGAPTDLKTKKKRHFFFDPLKRDKGPCPKQKKQKTTSFLLFLMFGQVKSLFGPK